MKTNLSILLTLIFCSSVFSQTDNFQSPDQIINDLYELVSFGPDSKLDWDQVRILFHPEAKIVLRTSKEATTVFDVDGFIKDFDDFAKNEKVQQNGFQEKILKKKETTFGNISHFLVLYEASFPGLDYPPQQGIDSFHLIKTDRGWKIISIVNEIVTPESELPEQLN
jgi:hypothetical protein